MGSLAEPNASVSPVAGQSPVVPMMPSSADAGMVRSVVVRSPLASKLIATGEPSFAPPVAACTFQPVAVLVKSSSSGIFLPCAVYTFVVADAVAPTAASDGSDPRTESTVVGVGVVVPPFGESE